MRKNLKKNKNAWVTGIWLRNAGKNLRAQEKEEINKNICSCCNKFVKTGIERGKCSNWFHYKSEEQVKNLYPEDMQYICKKDRLKKCPNAENSNNPNQNEMVVELKEKLWLSEMRQKETKSTLTELKKS